VAALYSLVHREEGPISTYLTKAKAERELEAVLRDEPDWADDLYIEPFEFVDAADADGPGPGLPVRR
jgi:hypothetical protein